MTNVKTPFIKNNHISTPLNVTHHESLRMAQGELLNVTRIASLNVTHHMYMQKNVSS